MLDTREWTNMNQEHFHNSKDLLDYYESKGIQRPEDVTIEKVGHSHETKATLLSRYPHNWNRKILFRDNGPEISRKEYIGEVFDWKKPESN